MTISIDRFPLTHFDELVPLLLRCFPDFWKPRLKLGLRSFPYDLKLFCAKVNGQMVGTVGIHEYRFSLNNKVIVCGGLSDVGVDPDFRGRGIASAMQDFALRYCRENYSCPVMPLYTDKPGVYLSRGWQLYEPDRTGEISSADFPKHDAFRLDLRKIRRAVLQLRQAPETPEEKICRTILKIYRGGQIFNGKCMRSVKTWLELFAEPEHEWFLEDDAACYLYRKDRLLEAFSADPAHPVWKTVPVQGGHNENKLMLALQSSENPLTAEIAEAVRKHSLLFPIADTF